MTNKDINFFKKYGYLIVTNKNILKLKKNIYFDLKIIVNKILSLNNIDNFKGNSFDNLIKYAFKFDKKYSIFSSCYDLLPGVLSVNKLANEKFL